MKKKTVMLLFSLILFILALIFYCNALGVVFHVYYGEVENAAFIISAIALFISSVFLFFKAMKSKE